FRTRCSDASGGCPRGVCQRDPPGWFWFFRRALPPSRPPPSSRRCSLPLPIWEKEMAVRECSMPPCSQWRHRTSASQSMPARVAFPRAKDQSQVSLRGSRPDHATDLTAIGGVTPLARRFPPASSSHQAHRDGWPSGAGGVGQGQPVHSPEMVWMAKVYRSSGLPFRWDDPPPPVWLRRDKALREAPP